MRRGDLEDRPHRGGHLEVAHEFSARTGEERDQVGGVQHDRGHRVSDGRALLEEHAAAQPVPRRPDLPADLEGHGDFGVDIGVQGGGDADRFQVGPAAALRSFAAFPRRMRRRLIPVRLGWFRAG